ncbi:hypothetical protein NECAME_00048 [Necator americanus]|uniref:Uncharacterized protein n=1 Tax=Necator americanus TaxID=51031 RepID=W2TZT1_NECAM|nr:hypothetical protein NECAME_00048 [Necator americanus]ETN87189.1 hypothetical protein NECAME_00048 [Necator americanus]
MIKYNKHESLTLQLKGQIRRNLKIVECLTLQGPIVRAFIVILNCHFIAERREEADKSALFDKCPHRQLQVMDTREKMLPAGEL